jgi:signal transduction histidine kinase
MPSVDKGKELQQKANRSLSFAQRLGACRDSLEVLEQARIFFAGSSGIALLVYQPWDSPTKIIEIGKSFWREKSIKSQSCSFQFFDNGISLGDRDLRLRLEKTLGRSVGQVVKFPLPLSRLFLRPILGANWIIETELSNAKGEISHWIQAIDLMKNTIDSLESMFELKREIYKSQKVFQQISDPLAVIGRDRHIFIKNKAFQKVEDSYHLEELFAVALSSATTEVEILRKNVKEFFHLLRPKNPEERAHRFHVILSSLHEEKEAQAERFLLCLRDSDFQLERIASLVHFERDEIFSNLKSEFFQAMLRLLTDLESLVQEFKEVVLKMPLSDRRSQLLKDVEIMAKGRERSLQVVRGLSDFFYQNNQRSSSDFLAVMELTASEILGHFLSYQIKLKERLQGKEGLRVKLPEVLLKQVLRNLILNSKQSFDEKRGEEQPIPYLTIEIWRENQRVFCRLKDRGYGIPPDLAERIFEPYFSLRKSKGTGLGLSFVKKVLDSSGGGIYLEEDHDQLGVGASFVFFLPEG